MILVWPMTWISPVAEARLMMFRSRSENELPGWPAGVVPTAPGCMPIPGVVCPGYPPVVPVRLVPLVRVPRLEVVPPPPVDPPPPPELRLFKALAMSLATAYLIGMRSEEHTSELQSLRHL